MKLDELLLSEEELLEINLRQIFTAAVLGTVALSAHTPMVPKDHAFHVYQKLKHDDVKTQKLVVNITKKYRIDPSIAYEIVQSAMKHEKAKFPKAEHILAVVGIESSFNHGAKSKLQKDPALGLMQVRPGVWKIDKNEMQEIDDQIRHGSQILDQYYQKLKDPAKALHAYNVGITAVKKGKRNQKYIDKFDKELRRYM